MISIYLTGSAAVERSAALPYLDRLAACGTRSPDDPTPELFAALGALAFGDGGPAGNPVVDAGLLPRLGYFEKLLEANPACLRAYPYSGVVHRDGPDEAVDEVELVFDLPGSSRRYDLGRITGYSSVIPLRKEASDRYLAGALSQFQFRAEHVANGIVPVDGGLYVQAAFQLNSLEYAEPARSTAMAPRRDDVVMEGRPLGIMRAMHRHLGDLLPGGPAEGLPPVFAEATTLFGQAVLDGQGFVPRGRSRDDHPIYDVRIDERRLRRMRP